jgi:hypothetical protein
METDDAEPWREHRKISQNKRRRRREEAKARLKDVTSLVHRHQVNREDMAHVTLWLDEQRRIEWWPGTARWAYDFGDETGRKHGDIDALIRFILEQFDD